MTGIKLPIAALLTFIPSSPLIFKLSPGVYNVMVRVTDSWGAETTFVLPNEIVVSNSIANLTGAPTQAVTVDDWKGLFGVQCMTAPVIAKKEVFGKRNAK